MGKMLPAVMVAGGISEAEMGQLMFNAFEGALIEAGHRQASVRQVRE